MFSSASDALLLPVSSVAVTESEELSENECLREGCGNFAVKSPGLTTENSTKLAQFTIRVVHK